MSLIPCQMFRFVNLPCSGSGNSVIRLQNVERDVPIAPVRSNPQQNPNRVRNLAGFSNNPPHVFFRDLKLQTDPVPAALLRNFYAARVINKRKGNIFN